MFNEFEKRLISSLILVPTVIFFIIQGSIFFSIFLSLIFLITSHEWLKMKKKNYIINFIGIIFLLISFYCAFYLHENNLVFFLLIVIVCIFTDVGGYIFGKTLKGPKLTKISPNKTYSGAIGSFLISLIAGLTYLDYLGDVNILNNDYFKIFLLIFFVSLTSQLGDLVISFFKRQAGLKDTGTIIPGHGGMLDRIDGLIFALPISYILILIMDFI